MMSGKMRWAIIYAAFGDDRKYIGKAFAGFKQIDHPGDMPFLWRVIDGDGQVYFGGECDNPSDFCEDEGCFAPQDFFEGHGVVGMEYMLVGSKHGWKLL